MSANVTATVGIGGPAFGYLVERYRYTPTGQVTVTDADGSTRNGSFFDWEYLYRGSRYNGPAYYLAGIEYNSLTGLPLREDPGAYYTLKNLWEIQHSDTGPDLVRESNAFMPAATGARAFLPIVGSGSGFAHDASLIPYDLAKGNYLLAAGDLSGAFGNFCFLALDCIGVGSLVKGTATAAIGGIGRAIESDAARALSGAVRAYGRGFAEGWAASAPGRPTWFLGANASNFQELFERTLYANRRGLTYALDGPGRIVFGELDNLLRPSGIYAEITRAMLRTGTTASAIPVGYLGRSAGHARGHLLANLLGGVGDDIRNLITLFNRPTNSPWMRDIELAVAREVERVGLVRYWVEPVYTGSNILADGIRIRATSAGSEFINRYVPNIRGNTNQLLFSFMD